MIFSFSFIVSLHCYLQSSSYLLAAILRFMIEPRYTKSLNYILVLKFCVSVVSRYLRYDLSARSFFFNPAWISHSIQGKGLCCNTFSITLFARESILNHCSLGLGRTLCLVHKNVSALFILAYVYTFVMMHGGCNAIFPWFWLKQIVTENEDKTKTRHFRKWSSEFAI